ncbi:uncharacterized protein LOC143546385 [Bidens hawaiensis]|uniref:uncharacterized protein LOC143546385 n=1 Tax=Bidens hawaiensis TaxID=980011 RepID=UPI0040496F09
MEVSNWQIKKFYKKTVRLDLKDWSNKLNDALWAYRTAFKTPIGTTPYRLIIRKGCHLPIKLAHRALWAVMNINLDYECAGKQMKLNICQLEELRDEAYECAPAYKDKMRRIKLFPEKLKSIWTGPYQVKRVGKFGEVEIEDFDDYLRKLVTGHHFKPYLEDADLM